MPTYEYACTACDERLEVVQKFTDAALTECPVCGGQLRKVFSAVGVVFKGSGFYKTDSRGKHGSSGKSSSKSESKSESSSSSSSSSSTSTSSSTPAAASTSTSSSTPSAAAS